MRYKILIKSDFVYPCGKADDTPYPALPRVRSSLLRLHPWVPWIWSILDFRSIEVELNQYITALTRLGAINSRCNLFVLYSLFFI